MDSRSPPLAGRPPFATDEPDSAYEDLEPAARRRQHKPKPQDTRPVSTYDVYDNYLDANANASANDRHSGYGNLGMGLLNGDMDDDSDDETLACPPDAKTKDKSDELEPVPAVPSVPLMAPKPGYAAQVSALDLTPPQPAASPPHHRGRPPIVQTAGQVMPIATPYGQQLPPSPRSGIIPPSMPSTPHPLQPPSTPIVPAFARPPKMAAVKFDDDKTIMRGRAEDQPLAKRGEKGDEFWRRFSMVVKEETSNRFQKSSWLKKSQSGRQRMSVWVWVVGVFLLALIAGAVGLGWYFSKSSATDSAPIPLGGSEQSGATLSFVPSKGPGDDEPSSTSTVKHVTPTNTVAKRWDDDTDASTISRLLPRPSGASHAFPHLLVPIPLPIQSGFVRKHAQHRRFS